MCTANIRLDLLSGELHYGTATDIHDNKDYSDSDNERKGRLLFLHNLQRNFFGKGIGKGTIIFPLFSFLCENVEFPFVYTHHIIGPRHTIKKRIFKKSVKLFF